MRHWARKQPLLPVTVPSARDVRFDLSITGVLTGCDLRTRRVDLALEGVVLTGLSSALDELTHEFAHHLRRRAVAAGVGLGHEDVGQLRFQLHGEHGFFGHDKQRSIYNVKYFVPHYRRRRWCLAGPSNSRALDAL